MEEWKTVPAFPAYEASSAGRLRRNGKLKVLSVDDKGYHVAFVAGKRRRVSRLIANAFLGFDFHSPILTVDHINRDTLNDAITNLRVATPAMQSANRDFSNLAKGKRMPVEQIDKTTGDIIAVHESVQEASRVIGKGNGGAGAICNVINGKSKSAYGYLWRYVIQDTADKDDEDWKPFEDVFVSSKGRIKRKTVSGYRVYDIDDYGKDGRYAAATVKGRRWPVHRLMAVVFMELDVNDKRRVGLKDGNPTNLCVDNLEIVEVESPPPTAQHKQIRPVGQWSFDGTMLLNRFESVNQAARVLKLDASSISKAAGGKLKHHGNFTWNYVD